MDDAEQAQRFGATVRELRKAQGISQERLAALAGIDRAYMGGLERGQRNPSLVMIARVARALGLPISKVIEPLDAES